MTTRTRHVSLADQVFEKLENDILSGVYARGEILTELRLVEELGVSRTPIREALRRLEQERLIEDTGKGIRRRGHHRRRIWRTFMNIRLRVEGLATYYATQNMTAGGARMSCSAYRRSAGVLLPARRTTEQHAGRWTTSSTTLICSLSGSHRHRGYAAPAAPEDPALPQQSPWHDTARAARLRCRSTGPSSTPWPPATPS